MFGFKLCVAIFLISLATVFVNAAASDKPKPPKPETPVDPKKENRLYLTNLLLENSRLRLTDNYGKKDYAKVYYKECIIALLDLTKPYYVLIYEIKIKGKYIIFETREITTYEFTGAIEIFKEVPALVEDRDKKTGDFDEYLDFLSLSERKENADVCKLYKSKPEPHPY